MDSDNAPIYGWNQPALGRFSELFSEGVSKAKTKKIVSRQARLGRQAVGRNFARIVAEAFPGKSRTYGYEQIEKDTGIALATLQRIAKGQTAATIDTLSDIAHNLGCSLSSLTAAPNGLADSKHGDPTRHGLHRTPVP